MEFVQAAEQYYKMVATAPTVYGIETTYKAMKRNDGLQLQQHLPFTVLKLR